ncbi:MAG: sugar ABC transporter ATP-binding protein [Solirubrobacteraceae bacterium]
MSSALSLTGVSHDYGDGPVLHRVDLSVAAGEVHALLGMNGSGKSTLVHIATGHVLPTSGEIRIDAVRRRFNSPADAIRSGVALLAQEVDRGVVGDATVHENLTAGLIRAEKAVVFSPRRNRARARELLVRHGVGIAVDRRVSELSLFEKQVLSLVRAASSNARYLFLDEPTSSFDAAETERFYGIVRRLTAEGIGIGFISHRLGEAFELADRVTVLRHGRVVLAAEASATTPEQVVAAITGDVSAPATHRRGAFDTARPAAFEADAIDLGRGRKPIPLRVAAGEVVAVYGPLGSGKTSLARTLFGLAKPLRARVGGREVRVAAPEHARKVGIAIVPEERRIQALWLDRDVRTHFSIGFRGLIRTRRELDHARRATQRFDVQPPDPRRLVGNLSGGNQQKVAIGKWSDAGELRLLILDEPMKGVDVAAKESIFRSIHEAAANGTGILYLTQEPEEALRVADRVIVLGRDGFLADRPVGEFDALDLLLEQGAAARGVSKP